MSDRNLTITDCMVVDPESGSVEPRTLSVVAGRICDTAGSSDAAQVAAAGLYAIPGLIDMHVHSPSDPSGQVAARPSDLTPTAMALTAVRNLGMALHSGVTTVRDLGSAGDVGYELKSAWERGLFVGSRPLVAGPVITAVGGHGTWAGVQSEGPHAVGALVRHNLAKGSDVVKLMMRSAARRMELRAEEVREAIDEAHWLGVPVAIHANFSERSIDVAVAAGCDTLEHGFAISDATASAMAKQGTALCATTVALRSIVEQPELWVRRGGRELVERAQGQFAEAQASFQRAMAAGVPLIAGTDAGVTGVAFDSLGRELESMVEWGATPQQALAAATVNAGRYLRRPELGSLAVGSQADIVLLRANPLDDIAACKSVEAVVQDGAIVRLDSPDRLLGGSMSEAAGTVLPLWASGRK